MRVSATPATPASPEPMKKVSWSTRSVATPLTAASCRFCITARIRRPAGSRVRYSQIPATPATASAMMNSRL